MMFHDFEASVTDEGFVSDLCLFDDCVAECWWTTGFGLICFFCSMNVLFNSAYGYVQSKENSDKFRGNGGVSILIMSYTKMPQAGAEDILFRHRKTNLVLCIVFAVAIDHHLCRRLHTLVSSRAVCPL